MEIRQQSTSRRTQVISARRDRLIGFSIAMATSVMISAGAAWAATLSWTANSEPDLAGYRVYRCSSLPCTRTSANAAVHATLGRVTQVDIGTPAAVQHYVITAFDSANNESGESNLATYTPLAPSPSPDPSPAPAPPPAPSNLRLSFGH